MNKTGFILCVVVIYLAGAIAETIIEDLSAYEREKQDNLTNISFENYAKFQDKDPCKSFVPLVPDLTKLKTTSEIKCKEYIWDLKNREEEERWRFSCHHGGKLSDGEVSYFTEGPIIHGGKDASVAQFPHMAAVGWRSKNPLKKWEFKCGSALISEKFLLTAAHCSKISPRIVTDIVNAEPEVVMLGVENIADLNGSKDRKPVIEKIKRIITHPDYKAPKKYNDIALLELENTVTFTPFILPACVWPYSEVETLDKMSLCGWGQTEKGQPSAILQFAHVEVLNTSKCDKLLEKFRNRNWNGFIEKQLCAGKLEGGIDTCQGDSGGPLQARLLTNTNDLMYMIVGVTSFGIKCAEENQPGVYTRVSSYTDWIEENVWK